METKLGGCSAQTNPVSDCFTRIDYHSFDSCRNALLQKDGTLRLSGGRGGRGGAFGAAFGTAAFGGCRHFVPPTVAFGTTWMLNEKWQPEILRLFSKLK